MKPKKKWYEKVVKWITHKLIKYVAKRYDTNGDDVVIIQIHYSIVDNEISYVIF